MNNHPGKTEEDMAMIMLLLVSLIFKSATAAIGEETVSRVRRDSAQQFHNPEAGLLGYDLTKSDVMSSTGDPGKRGQLFEPFVPSSTKFNPTLSRLCQL